MPTTRAGVASERQGRARPPPVFELLNGEPLEFEMDMDPSISEDLAMDLPRIFLNSLGRRMGSIPQEMAPSRMRDVRRVLQEAERVMGTATGIHIGRAQSEARGGEGMVDTGTRSPFHGQGHLDPAEQTLGYIEVQRGEQREVQRDEQTDEQREQRRTQSPLDQTPSQTAGPTEPRYTSVPDEIQAICARTVTRINCLMRSVNRRVREGFAIPEELNRTYQIVEIILGLRSGFAENGADLTGSRTARHPMALSNREMETILLNLHHDHPEWRQEDEPDLVLQKFHSCIEDGDLVEYVILIRAMHFNRWPTHSTSNFALVLSRMLQLIPRMRHPIYHRDVAGETALHVACLHGREEEAQLLLDMGHYADPCCLDGSTPLADAASGGFANLVALLAMRTPHCVNMADVDGDAPLHNAARGDHPDVVRVLLEAGADTTKINHDGERPIDLAVENSRCHRLLSTRLAAVDGRDREVLQLFRLYSSQLPNENEGFTIVDLVALSNGRLSPDGVVSAVRRLTALGILEERGIGDTHWSLVSGAVLAERGLTYE